MSQTFSSAKSTFGTLKQNCYQSDYINRIKRKKTFYLNNFVILTCLILTGCASILDGDSQEIKIKTTPPGATCQFIRKGEVIGSIAETPLTSHVAIFRSDGKEIGVVGKGYELVQPYQTLDFATPYLDTGLCTLESGGSL